MDGRMTDGYDVDDGCSIDGDWGAKAVCLCVLYGRKREGGRAQTGVGGWWRRCDARTMNNGKVKFDVKLLVSAFLFVVSSTRRRRRRIVRAEKTEGGCDIVRSLLFLPEGDEKCDGEGGE